MQFTSLILMISKVLTIFSFLYLLNHVIPYILKCNGTPKKLEMTDCSVDRAISIELLQHRALYQLQRIIHQRDES